MSAQNETTGLRIGLIGPLPPPSGGMANQTRQLARLLAREGIAVELVQTNPPYQPAWVARLWLIRALFRLVPYLKHLWCAIGHSDVVHIMANSGWAWHMFAAPAIWLAWLRRKPILLNYRGGLARQFLESSIRFVKPSLNRCQIIAVPSGFLEQIFAQFDVPTVVVPNIVDLSRFKPEQRKADKGQVRLVVTRNLEKIYDVPTALRAYAQIQQEVPRSELLVAGSGPERTNLERLTNELGIRDQVHFTGRLDPEEMAKLYRTADIVLNPSSADNMPNSLLEAMASGVPVVSTNVGGIPFMLEDRRTGMLVPVGDAPAMATAALEVLQNDSLRNRICMEAIREVESFTWEKVKGVLFHYYQESMMMRKP